MSWFDKLVLFAWVVVDPGGLERALDEYAGPDVKILWPNKPLP